MKYKYLIKNISTDHRMTSKEAMIVELQTSIASIGSHLHLRTRGEKGNSGF